MKIASLTKGKIMKEIFDYYIYPERARAKIKMAQEFKNPVYLFGMTGYGKTTFLQHFFENRKYNYFSAGEVLEVQLEPENFKDGSIVIIDDIQMA